MFFKNAKHKPKDESDDIVENSHPRLIHRTLPYHQSRNVLHIVHRKCGKDVAALRAHDWFHVLLRMSTLNSVGILLTSWTGLILFFAAMYYVYDIRNTNVVCRMGNDETTTMTFGGAFAFSLQTCSTVGYTLPGGTNAFFEHCPALQILVYSQMLISMMINSFLFAFFFARLAKSENRGAQVVFGKQCVIRTEHDQQHGTSRIVLQVRVYDIDARHPVVEAHVRLYALFKAANDEPQHPYMIPLRIVSPNDELNGSLLTSIPSVVTHELDVHSPLHCTPKNLHRLSSGALLLREVDSLTGNREEIICPVCGEAYGSWERLRSHVKYNQLVERRDNIPIEGSHQVWDAGIFAPPKLPTIQEIQKDFRLQELLVVVEGIDPLMSGTFQALQSYTPEDICWGGRFVPCLYSSPNLKSTLVDLEAFHAVEIVEHTTAGPSTHGDDDNGDSNNVQKKMTEDMDDPDDGNEE